MISSKRTRPEHENLLLRLLHFTGNNFKPDNNIAFAVDLHQFIQIFILKVQ